MSHPTLTDVHREALYTILKNNPLQEVVGYFSIEPETTNILEIIEVARGDDEKVAYREFQEYPFHTHPLSTLKMSEPPSGEDLLQSLSWGYPDFKEKKRGCTWECVVASEGLWWYRPTVGLKQFYFDLQETDEEQQNYIAKQVVRYMNAVGTLFKNRLIDLREFLSRSHMIDFAWMQELLMKNPVFLTYLNKYFQLASMIKLKVNKYPDVRYIPGFEIIFETAA